MLECLPVLERLSPLKRRLLLVVPSLVKRLSPWEQGVLEPALLEPAFLGQTLPEFLP